MRTPTREVGRGSIRCLDPLHLRTGMNPQDMMKKPILFGLLATIVLLSACARPECHNTNPVFDRHAPYSKVYKDELVAQLKTMDSAEVRYWIDTYEGLDGKVLLHVFVQGGDLCAKAVLVVPPELAGRMYEKQGAWKHGFGYHGAEVIGLRYDVVQTTTSTEMVYRGRERVID